MATIAYFYSAFSTITKPPEIITEKDKIEKVQTHHNQLENQFRATCISWKWTGMNDSLQKSSRKEKIKKL